MNTLHHTSNRAAQESPLRASGELVYCLRQDAPVAQAAEGLLADWLRQPRIRLLLLPEQRLSAFLEATRGRLERLEPVKDCIASNLATAILRVVDAGACLIAGGQSCRPALATNVQVSDTLLKTLGQPVPLLLVGTLEENTAKLPQLEDFFSAFPPLPETN